METTPPANPLRFSLSPQALEYVSAVLGTGKEYFGLESSLHPAAAPAWLPFNLLDQLLLELGHNKEVKVFSQVSNKETGR